MNKKLLYFAVSLLITLNSYAIYQPFAIVTDSINDGPYIFKLNDTLKARWIKNSVLKEDIILPSNFDAINMTFRLSNTYRDLTDTYLLKSKYKQVFRGIDSISVISDIHGNYTSYINLLRATGVIDKNLNWKFGTGHLVVLGDIFDRGDLVTEVLWHLFGMEKQAAKVGGKVHVLLGNHEVMVLNKDLRFIHEKYAEVAEISNDEYSELYSEKTVLGKWLRTKPVMITINDIVFVHAGLSIELVHKNLKIKQINKIFSDKIVGKEMQPGTENEKIALLSENNGPLWYRGYFLDRGFAESELDSILDFYSKQHIVVGHTSFKEIKSLFNNKIFGVDAGIMNGLPGEMLIYKNGAFYKGLVTGERIRLP